jgi:nucleoside-diphosphate-sugar epimerase
MRALVTGGAGFIGSATAQALADAGYETHVLTRPSTRLDRIEGLSLDVHRIDLLDHDGLTRLVGSLRPECVVNAAARGGHPGLGEERLEAWRDNTLSLVSLLEALRVAPPRKLVHLGSSLEYAPSDHPHVETETSRPDTARGTTKLAATAALEEWVGDTGVPYANLRLFSVYGPGEAKRRVVPQVIHALRSDTPFRSASARSRRDFVNVADVTRAILSAVADPEPNGLVNVGTGVETSVEELIAIAEEVTGLRIRYAEDRYPRRPADREHSSADISRARAVLGWEPAVTLADGLADLWAVV